MHKSRKKYREREIDSKKLERERTMKMLHVIKMMTMKMNDNDDNA